jgi:Tol biopolymer transport system component
MLWRRLLSLWLLVGAFAVSADVSNQTLNDYIAYSAPSGNDGAGLFIVNPHNADEKFLLTTCHTACESITWSADRQHIGYLDGEQLRVIELDGTLIRNVTIDRGTYPYNVRPVWDDDLKQAVFNARYHARNQLVIVDMETGETRLLGGGGEHLVWLDGAVGYSHLGKIRTIDLTTGLIRTLTPHGDYHDQPMWSPDKTQIAFRVWMGGDEYALAMMDADGSNGRVLLDGIVERPRWSDDGRYIATIQWNNLQGTQSTVVIVDTMDDSYQLLTPRANVVGLEVVWGDHHLAYIRRGSHGSKQLIIYDIHSGVEQILSDEIGERPQQIAWK